MDAIEGFDLTRGVKFETYAAPRINGAMLDALRVIDSTKRTERKNSSIYDVTREELMSLRRGPVSVEDIEARLIEK